MTPQEIQIGLGRLKAAYPSTKFDDFNVAAYSEVMADFDNADFTAAWKGLVTSSEFFPSLAKIADAVSVAARTRFQAKEREEREERLAIQAGEDRIMDSKSDLHRDPIGPNHKIFLEYLNGTRTFPEPDWVTKKKASGAAVNDGKYKPISDSERREREMFLAKQAAELLRKAVA